jgi:DNA-binding LacI/PurR family transcriptional regulator
VPKFTCVHQKEQRIGEIAADILVKNINNPIERESWQHEKLSCELWIGGSVKKIKQQE